MDTEMKPTPEQIANELPQLKELRDTFGSFSITEYRDSNGTDWASNSDPDWGDLVIGVDWIRRKI